jgi:hypothetical protein
LIARILKGSVAAELVPAFHAMAGGTMLEVRKQGGLCEAFVARQIESDGSEQIVFTTVWEDMPALYAWIGACDLMEVPAPIQAFEGLVAARDLQYFEVLELIETKAEGVASGRGR